LVFGARTGSVASISGVIRLTIAKGETIAVRVAELRPFGEFATPRGL
jgi:hypothetical protein